MGARVQVCGFIVSRKPEHSVLWVRSAYGAWMPPQEGVLLRESLEDAFWRCLLEELGVAVVAERRRELLHVRSISRLGVLPMTPERKGERPVADDVGDGPLSSVKMTKKAYWGAYAIAADQADLDLVPNHREVQEAAWLSFEEARARVDATVRPEKAALIHAGLDTAEQCLVGIPEVTA